MMIDMIHFDTLKYVETLQAAGVPEKQAKAFSKVQQDVLSECLDTTFSHKLATKTDIVDVREDIAALESDMVVMKSDITALKTDVSLLKEDVSVLKFDVSLLKMDVSVLKIDVFELKSDMKLLKWMTGFTLAGIASIIVQNFFSV